MDQELESLVGRGPQFCDLRLPHNTVGQPTNVAERLFASEEPACGGSNYKVVQQITTDAVVLYLQPRVGGYIYDAQRAAPDELSLGGEAKGAVTKDEGGSWVSSSI